MQLLSEIVAGQDRNHAGHRLRLGSVDGNYFGVRVRTAQKCEVEHAGQMDVLNIAAGATDQRPVFDPAYWRADQSIRGVLGCHNKNLSSEKIDLRPSSGVTTTSHTSTLTSPRAAAAWSSL